MQNNNNTRSQVQPDVSNLDWGNANSDRLGYDGSSRMISKRYLSGGINGTTHAYNDTGPVVGFTTQYDLSGNKMYERELHAETRSHLYQPFDDNGVPLGGYDSVDRLRKALRGELSDDGGYTATGGGSITTPIALPDTDTSRTYDLDGLGNWKQSDYIPVGGMATIDLRQHNKLNEITSRKIGDDTKVLFAYDGTNGASNGNLADDGTLMLSYDAFNRLIQVNRKSDGATIGQYVYDALNRRVSKTISNGGLTGDIPNGSTGYLYQNWQVVEERNGSDSTIKQYVWGQYIDECIQLKTLTTTGPGSLPTGDYYPLQDVLCRTIALTDDDGDIVEAYDYDAYGNTLIFSAAGTNDNWWADDASQANYAAYEVLYCGYRYDPESELYQVRNREYNPTVGRWLQRDPVGFAGGDWNLYGYVGGNSVTRTDSYGFAWSTADFLRHYYARVGGIIDLSVVGLQSQFFNSTPVRHSIEEFYKKLQEETNKLLTKGNYKCKCKGAKGVETHIQTQDKTTTNVTHVDNLFAIGHSTFFRKGYCKIKIDCTRKHYNASCHFRFWIRDKFEDPVGLHIELGGVPYGIYATQYEVAAFGGSL